MFLESRPIIFSSFDDKLLKNLEIQTSNFGAYFFKFGLGLTSSGISKIFIESRSEKFDPSCL